MRIHSILTLFKKDVLLELRQQYALYGVILYVVSTVFVLYLAINQPEAETWNALFWVMQLFVCINAVAKSFLQESRGRMLYYYAITSPVEFVLSKILYNLLLMTFMNATDPAVVHGVHGQPNSTFLAIPRDQFPGITGTQPDIYHAGSDCFQSPATGIPDGDPWISGHYSAITARHATLKDSIC